MFMPFILSIKSITDSNLSLSVLFHSNSSRSENGDANDRQGCCKLSKCCSPFCASRFCLPCRRLRNISCCKRHKDIEERPKEPIVAAATVDETDEQKTKMSCWRCCRRGKENKKDMMEIMKSETVDETSASMGGNQTAPKSGGCKRCLLKVFCCKSVNRVQSGDVNSMDRADESPNCCLKVFCCRCKKKEPAIREVPARRPSNEETE